MRTGARIAVDVGEVRVGVARSDSAGILATPVGTFQRHKDDFSAVISLVHELDALEVIVGLPLNMDGSEGKSAKNARRWARRVARRIYPVSVRLVDERLSTVSAHSLLHQAGRKEITHRSVIDQVAAVIILESALAQERSTLAPPGELVEIQEN
ncbi:Holliday junction resolvase RuvX [Arcanobacterium buesumense]|uniref:Putative pre-16S rRNA nuclease n=1 Tax=Arcanobacterium buesumense TaxID=2722751 RepID=A0A6H2EL50_9ACTO|nr:Holliday junction resolvase RuvX [Arcanobacterium buesumense]QJC21749.1 Holliday junction resolvase RuvX [Arcanobacterium buesumense]